jgi:hypothetical protein
MNAVHAAIVNRYADVFQGSYVSVVKIKLAHIDRDVPSSLQAAA